MAFEIRRYRTAAGDEPFTEWLGALTDRQAVARVLVRLERLELGNAGDAHYLRDGVSELRIDWGPGYRIYFGREQGSIVVLLCGGDKRRQAADVERAVRLWHEYGNRRKALPRAKR